MNNIKKYDLDDLNHGHYIKLLRLAKKKYIFRTYSNLKKTENFILWRHDIDAEMASAKRLAEIEKSEGVKTTYFVLLHSPMYNLLQKSESECLREIIKMGHYIGLHFDTNYYSIKNERELVKYLKSERALLEMTFGIKISAFAFHNPAADCLKYNKWSYAGLINTYAKYFAEEVGYSSDSNGHWRHDRMEDVLKKGPYKRLQVLTHPLHWQEKTGYPKHKVWSSVLGRAQQTVKDYDAVLETSGRENIGELNIIFDFLRSFDNKIAYELEQKYIMGEYADAYLKLWRFHQILVNSFLKFHLEFVLLKSKRAAAGFYADSLEVDLYKRFELVTGLSFFKTFGIRYKAYQKLIDVKDDIVNAGGKYAGSSIRKAFVQLAGFLIKLESVIRK